MKESDGGSDVVREKRKYTKKADKQAMGLDLNADGSKRRVGVSACAMLSFCMLA